LHVRSVPLWMFSLWIRTMNDLIRKAVDDCFEWRGGKSEGYGRKHFNGRTQFTHRIAWEWANGPIPEGMCVLHTCDNRACCNPNHLFLGTKGDNARDMCSKGRHANQVKAHCTNGHEFMPSNTYIDNDGWRRCKTCSRESLRRFRENRRDQ